MIKKKTIILLFILLTNTSFAKITFEDKGKIYFNSKNFSEAKYYFEKDIVFNPKNIESYLYLAKIYHELKDIEEEEKNLKKVLLLDPKNEEGLYLLISNKFQQSDFEVVKKEIKTFEKVCKKMCKQISEIKEKILE